MSTRIRRRLVRSLLVLLLSLALPSLASAANITINAVQVAIGDHLFDAATVGWHFPLTLQPGESLLLAQNGPGIGEDAGTGFNFDTSDASGCAATDTLATCTPALAHICLGVNGIDGCFIDDQQILTAGGFDGGGQNEMHDWSPRLSTSTIDWTIQLGYGDNVHPGGVCSTPTCLPTTPLSGYTYVMAAASIISVDLAALGARFWDGGWILITNTSVPERMNPVPEPASLVLLGVGLIGVGARMRRRGLAEIRRSW